MKALRSIFLGILAVLVLALGAVYVVLRIPAVQTALVHEAADMLSGKIDGEIRVGRLTFVPLHTVILNDVSIVDAEADTVAAFGKLTVNLSTRSVLGRENLLVHRICLYDGKADIEYISPEETNIGRIITQLIGESKGGFELPWKKITVRKVRVKGLDLTYRNAFAEADETSDVCSHRETAGTCSHRGNGKFNFNNLHVKDFNLKLDDITYSGANDISATLTALSFTEENSGFSLDNLSCSASLDKDGLTVDGLCFDDGKSLLSANCGLEFTSFEDFKSLTDSVPVNLHIAKSRIDLASAKPFISGLGNADSRVWFSADISGTISDLKADNFKIESEDGKSAISLDAAISGLPDLENAVADICIPSMETDLSSLENLLHSFSPSIGKGSISKFDPGEPITLEGCLAGPISSIAAKLTLCTGHCGSLTADAVCKGLTGGSGPLIKGTLIGNSIALGKFLKDTTFGELSFNGGVSAKFGNELSASIDKLKISEFVFHGYNYRDIVISGAYGNDNVAVKLKSDDPNINVAAEALAKLGNKDRSSYLAADIDLTKADLAALNLDKREVCHISGKAKADIELTTGNTVIGKAGITGLRGHLKDGVCDFGDIQVKADLEQDKYKVRMDSKLAEATYEGTESMGELISDVKVILAKELGNLLQIDGNTIHRSEGSRGCNITLKTGDLTPLTTFLMPDIFIAEGTSVKIDLDGSNSLALNATAPTLAFGKNYIRNLNLAAGSAEGPINATLKSDLISIGDFALRNNTLVTEIKDNKADLNLNFDNGDKEKRKGTLAADITFPAKTADSYIVRADIKPSQLELEDCVFDFHRARICYRDKYLKLDKMRISSGTDQYLSAEGTASESPDDKMTVTLNSVDVSMLSGILKSSIDVKGIFDGTATAYGLFGKHPGLTGDILATDMAISEEPLGDLRLLCKWSDEQERFNILVDNTLEDSRPLNATGYFKPSDKTLGVNAAIDRFGVSWLDPFLSGIVSDMGGTISGNVKMEGPLNNFSISASGTRFDRLACKVDFTQVPYVIDGPFSLSEKGITFDNDTISDLYGNKGRVSGGVSFDRFKDIRFGVRFKLRNMQALNTTAANEENGFYGKAFASGTVDITGPIDKIRLGIDIRTGDGSVHIPLSSSGNEKTSILTFVDRSRLPSAEDSMMLLEHLQGNAKHSSLGVNIKLDVTNRTEVGLDINRSLGDMLKAHGTGNIEINAGEGSFGIKGGYGIEDGSYKLALMGITSKDFIINPGGTINFNGDIMQSDLDITATYRTKASIGTLISDSTSVNSRRTVNCGIGIDGKLSNPQLNFSIDIPDLDPTTQGLVESALSTEEKRLKQVLALLVSGSFVPDEQSGIVNNTTVLYSNASEIMANQINTIFRQLDIPLDLGFNYQPGSGGVDIFDVAISTQLFNNRVTINGNIGNQDYLTTSNTSEVVGNVDVEIKMNKSGKLRLNLFSHAADRYSNYLDQTQRNGAGVVYQEEFDTFKDLMHKIFRKRRPNVGNIRNPEENGKQLEYVDIKK